MIPNTVSVSDCEATKDSPWDSFVLVINPILTPHTSPHNLTSPQCGDGHNGPSCLLGGHTPWSSASQAYTVKTSYPSISQV